MRRKRYLEDLSDVKINWHSVRRILRYATTQKWSLLLFVLIISGSAFLGAQIPLLFKKIVDVGIMNQDISYVLRVTVIVTVLSIISAVLSLSIRYLSNHISQQFLLNIQRELFSHIQTLSMSFFSEMKTGALIQRIQSDVRGAQSIFTQTLNNVLSNVLTLVFVLIAMFSMSPVLTGIVLLGVPLLLIPMYLLKSKLTSLTRISYDLNATSTQLASERFNVGGAFLMKTDGNLDEDLNLYTDTLEDIKDVALKRTLYHGVVRIGITLVSSISLALIYGVGGMYVIQDVLSVGTLLAMATYLNKLYNPVISLSNMHLDILNALVSFERIFEILDTKAEVAESENPQTIQYPSVRFDNVSFGYDGEDLIGNISFDIQPKEKVAIVGPSGAGKSTITKLLLRLYDPNEGDIYIGKQNLKDISFDDLKDKVGVVSQDAYMFHDTIANNLRYVKKDVSESEMIAVLKDVLLWDLIKKLPDGLDTVVGDRGYRLSGGERQRLAIARMLLKRPEIIILDEASAHLDSESESLVQKALDRVLADKTSLIVAHRLSTIKTADKIIVMDQGRIIESGNHNQLVEEEGLYAHLQKLQFES